MEENTAAMGKEHSAKVINMADYGENARQRADAQRADAAANTPDDEHVFAGGYAFRPDETTPVNEESAERAQRVREELGDEPLVGIENRPGYRFVKRAFDIVFSALVMVLFCWLYAIIAIMVKVDDPKGPVFFKQERVGRGACPSRCTSSAAWSWTRKTSSTSSRN